MTFEQEQVLREVGSRMTWDEFADQVDQLIEEYLWGHSAGQPDLYLVVTHDTVQVCIITDPENIPEWARDTEVREG